MVPLTRDEGRVPLGSASASPGLFCVCEAGQERPGAGAGTQQRGGADATSALGERGVGRVLPKPLTSEPPLARTSSGGPWEH